MANHTPELVSMTLADYALAEQLLGADITSAPTMTAEELTPLIEKAEELVGGFEDYEEIHGEPFPDHLMDDLAFAWKVLDYLLAHYEAQYGEW